MKPLYIFLLVVAIVAGFYFFAGPPNSIVKNLDNQDVASETTDANSDDQTNSDTNADIQREDNDSQRSLGDDSGMEFPTLDVEKLVVADGSYTVDTQSSVVRWSGKKPLISGYTNSGTIGVSSGSITVADNTASGEFTIDMDTLDVGLTAKKPGQEGALEGHLKGERWFDTATYPTATFVITNVNKRADSDATHIYDVTGDLTMKGITNRISFPAEIYQTASGEIRAIASTEIDRTKWGITAGSGSFFDDLADNVIDDMIAISFDISAQ